MNVKSSYSLITNYNFNYIDCKLLFAQWVYVLQKLQLSNYHGMTTQTCVGCQSWSRLTFKDIIVSVLPKLSTPHSSPITRCNWMLSLYIPLPYSHIYTYPPLLKITSQIHLKNKIILFSFSHYFKFYKENKWQIFSLN